MFLFRIFDFVFNKNFPLHVVASGKENTFRKKKASIFVAICNKSDHLKYALLLNDFNLA